MYGGTWNPVQRPDDDEFYCVKMIDGASLGKVDPGKGSFEDMVAKARSILADELDVIQVHVNHKGNFWERVTRTPNGTPDQSRTDAAAPWMDGPGNKRDRKRFAALTSDQRQTASDLAASKYDGSRTVARCWVEALDETA